MLCRIQSIAVEGSRASRSNWESWFLAPISVTGLPRVFRSSIHSCQISRNPGVWNAVGIIPSHIAGENWTRAPRFPPWGD